MGGQGKESLDLPAPGEEAHKSSERATFSTSWFSTVAPLQIQGKRSLYSHSRTRVILTKGMGNFKSSRGHIIGLQAPSTKKQTKHKTKKPGSIEAVS